MANRLTLVTDYPVTRRKSFHVIVGPDDEPIYWTQRLGDALEWLLMQDQRHFAIRVDDRYYLVRLNPLKEKKEPTNG